MNLRMVAGKYGASGQETTLESQAKFSAWSPDVRSILQSFDTAWFKDMYDIHCFFAGSTCLGQVLGRSAHSMLPRSV